MLAAARRSLEIENSSKGTVGSRLFERAAAFANNPGLLAEEVDGANGELLGNFPRAFSYGGLVNAAWVIAQAEAGCWRGCGDAVDAARSFFIRTHNDLPLVIRR